MNYFNNLLIKMDVKVMFIYEDKIIQVFSSPEEEMKKLFEKFKNQVNAASEITDYIFYYERNILEPDSTTIAKNNFIGGKSEISISVQKNLRIIKCPLCNYNDCVINLSDYLVSFYGCEHNHSISKNYDDYLGTQKMVPSKIKCCSPGCELNQSNNTRDFHLCLTCSNIFKNSQSYCDKCISNHDRDHKSIKFDLKNYFCRKHVKDTKMFIKYCFSCKKNFVQIV